MADDLLEFGNSEHLPFIHIFAKMGSFSLQSSEKQSFNINGFVLARIILSITIKNG